MCIGYVKFLGFFILATILAPAGLKPLNFYWPMHLTAPGHLPKDRLKQPSFTELYHWLIFGGWVCVIQLQKLTDLELYICACTSWHTYYKISASHLCQNVFSVKLWLGSYAYKGRSKSSCPCTLRMIKSRNCAIILSLCLDDFPQCCSSLLIPSK